MMSTLLKSGGYTYTISRREDGRFAYDVQGIGWGESGSQLTLALAEQAVDRCLAKRRVKDAA